MLRLGRRNGEIGVVVGGGVAYFDRVSVVSMGPLVGRGRKFPWWWGLLLDVG